MDDILKKLEIQCDHCGARGGEHHQTCPTLLKPVIETAICESCLLMMPKGQLARFGRSHKAPMVCKTCAEYMLKVLEKAVIDPYHRPIGLAHKHKKEIIN